MSRPPGRRDGGGRGPGRRPGGGRGGKGGGGDKLTIWEILGFAGWYALEDDGTTRPLRAGELPAVDVQRNRVAESTVAGMWVSTVFLGLNHAHFDGPPILFETMVFSNQKDMSDLACFRYTTKAAAETGHAAVVAALEAGVDPGEIEVPS